MVGVFSAGVVHSSGLVCNVALLRSAVCSHLREADTKNEEPGTFSNCFVPANRFDLVFGNVLVSLIPQLMIC